MVCSIRKFVALLMLAVLVTNACVWNSCGERIAHQIIHIGQIDQGAGNHAHPALAAIGEPGKVLHQVLHAVDHLQHVVDLAEQTLHPLPPAGIAPAVADERAPEVPALDPPFRPPSGAAILA